jgi:hypothetical protein
MFELIVQNVTIGRQISTATCWANAVAAVGKALRPSSQTTGTALVVAEGIQPNLRLGDLESASEYRTEKRKNSEANALLAKREKDGKTKEQRDPAKMLRKHFELETLVTEYSPTQRPTDQDKSEALKTFFRNIKKERPVLVGVQTTKPFIPRDGTAEYYEMHMILCYGIRVAAEKSAKITPDVVTLLFRDPANPNSEFQLIVPFLELFSGFLYIRKDELGPRFNEKYSNAQDFHMHVVRLIRATYTEEEKSPAVISVENVWEQYLS